MDILCSDCGCEYEKLDEWHVICPKCGDIMEVCDGEYYATDGYRIVSDEDFADF